MNQKIKLAPPANTSTVKVSFAILEEEMKRLADYARCYNETYDAQVKPADLVAQIVGHFLNTDRGYRAWRGKKVNGREAVNPSAADRPRDRMSVPAAPQVRQE